MAIALSASDKNSGTSSATVSSLTLTAGQLVTVVAPIVYTSAQTPAAGDLTLDAGSAILGTPTLDKYLVFNSGDAPYYIGLAFYSVLVTGSGSAAIRVTPTGTSGAVANHLSVWDGNWDASRVESAPVIASSATNNQSTHSSASATSAGAALFLGGLSILQTSNVSITQDASFTLLTEYEDGTAAHCGGASYRIVSSGTTDTSDYTSGGTNLGWASGLVVYKEVSSGIVTKTASDALSVADSATATITRWSSAAYSLLATITRRIGA